MTFKFTDIFTCDLVAHVDVKEWVVVTLVGKKRVNQTLCLFLWSALILNLTHLQPLCFHLHLF